jgi:spermidine synthase
MKSKYLFTKIFITGGITLGLELAASRILTPFFGVSLFVWSSILSITLIALALGYKYGGVLAAKLPREKSLVLFAAAGGIAALWLDLCAWTYPYMFWPLADFDLVFGSIVACLYLLFVPLFILSALNPLLVSLLTGQDEKGDHGAGKVFFVSTAGSVGGVFIVAYGLLPFLTNYQVVLVLALIAAAMSVAMLWQLRGAGSQWFRNGFAASVAALVLTIATLATGGLQHFTKVTHLADRHELWRVLTSRPSYFGHLQIIEVSNDSGGPASKALMNDGLTQNIFYPDGMSGGLYTYMLERLALAAVENPRKAIVLGLGAGTIPMSFAYDDIYTEAVEINPAMLRMAVDHFEFDPRQVKVTLADARTAARHCDRDHDIVAIDLFHDDGIPEHLVTREFFNDLKNCLKDGGVIVMNSFMNLENKYPEYALLQTIADVFGELTFFEQPPQVEGSHFTAGFIVARKNAPVGRLAVSSNNMPAGLARDLVTSVKTEKIIRPGDPMLEGAPVLTDMSNQWKRLAWPNELAYRRLFVSKVPWQILMN